MQAADWSEKTNIWEDGTMMAPFDMPFFLQMNVAVGSVQGADAGGFFPAEVCSLRARALFLSQFLPSRQEISENHLLEKNHSLRNLLLSLYLIG